MSFLDNSGDIILDAVLTDTGRMRLSKGDGSFKIVKFALGDDEINYTLYRNSNSSKGAHPSGSAYFDLDILQSPVLEAFTNNTSTMNSKLISIPRTDILFLPLIKLNEENGAWAANTNSAQAADKFVVLVNEDSSRSTTATTNPGLFQTTNGMINGITGEGTLIRVDQGLDTNQIPPSTELSKDLVETQYIIEMDNRLGQIVTGVGNSAGIPAAVSFIDDDNIASYFLSLGTDDQFVRMNNNKDNKGDSAQTIEGPRGTTLKFKIKSNLEIQTSNYLFEKIGTTSAAWTADAGAATVNYIDTTVRVTGATTGYRVDIPVRFVKVVSTTY